MSLRDFEKNLKKEYNETFKEHKPRFRFTFKLRHALAIVVVMLGLFLIVEHMSVSIYNNKLDKERKNLYDINETSFVKLEKIDDYKNVVGLKNNKTSILSKCFRVFSIKSYVKYDTEAELAGSNARTEMAEEKTGAIAPEASVENATNTNVQVTGIDEADYSKCDGTYIYSLHYGNFMIFDLSGTKIVNKKVSMNLNNLYIYEDKIILIGTATTVIYKFDGNDLTELKTFNYKFYNDSRLTNNYFYLIFNNDFDNEQEYKDMYYDQVSYTNRVYSIIKYDLDSNEYKEVNNLNSGNVTLYMSNQHIYLATTVYARGSDYFEMTVTSVFDHDLNPIAALRVKGTVLNQFSMDEYDKYFRIVTTNNQAENEKLNAISIFDLENRTLVGYLNEGIGLGRQVVKSVRFDDTTCYVVTYLNTDPLYEIDLTDPANPKIVSEYQSPGYSSYLHTFIANGEEYLFGIGYCDDQSTRKISVYKNDENTTQIGSDLIISDYFYTTSDNNLLKVNEINYKALNDHRALFIYQKNDILYLGIKASPTEYYFFKIDVTSENVISVYDTIQFNEHFYYSRCYLVNNKIYITNGHNLYIKEVK